MEVEAKQESSKKEPGSNLNCEDQQTQNNSSTSSYAKTRTALVSYNGYSKEVFKINQHLKPFEVTKVQPPSGFENEDINATNDMEA